MLLLRKYYVLSLFIFVFSLFSSTGFLSASSDDCKQTLVALLENNADKATMHELFIKCSAHGSAEKQVRSARELAVALKKPVVVERADQTLYEMNLEQQKLTGVDKSSEGMSWWKWALGAWACLGCCVAIEKEIDDYYYGSGKPVHEETEEEAQKRKIEQAQMQQIKKFDKKKY